MCKHAKGAFCSFRHGKSEHKPAPVASIAFTKAPCHSDSPKAFSPQVAKDYLLPVTKNHFYILRQGTLPAAPFSPVPLRAGREIDRPPRIF